MIDFGIVAINKPAGISSFDCIRQIRYKLKIKKVGHCGTLDPFATGLLIVLLGRATRLASFVEDEKKEYLATMQLGVKTDTGDLTGKPIKTSSFAPKVPVDLGARVKSLNVQIPPKYSALKVNGKRAYKLARKDISFTLKPRAIKVFSFKIVDYTYPFLTYITSVSKGTYIRVLSEDIANMLGCVATTSKLCRTRIGDITLDSCVEIEKINSKNLKKYLLSADKVLNRVPSIQIDKKQVEDLRFGRRIVVQNRVEGFVKLFCDGGFCGIAKFVGQSLQPHLIL